MRERGPGWPGVLGGFAGELAWLQGQTVTGKSETWCLLNRFEGRFLKWLSMETKCLQL